MCGIAGAVDLRGSREFSTRRLLAMTAAIAHRGPDDEQVHIEPGVALGTRRLATRCDTEAWVHLYEDLREGMFARARGQFAVSLWDRTSRTLILGRDRVGICPLHYTEVEGWLL